jgi:hypothetical protein
MNNTTESISIPAVSAAASSRFNRCLLGCALIAALGGDLAIKTHAGDQAAQPVTVSEGSN